MVRTVAGIGELRRETSQDKAGRIIRDELKRLGWKESDLTKRVKGDPSKLALGERLRHETTLTIREIAERLRMGSWKSLNNKLYLQRKANKCWNKSDKVDFAEKPPDFKKPPVKLQM